MALPNYVSKRTISPIVGIGLAVIGQTLSASACDTVPPIPFISGVQAYVDSLGSIKDERLVEIDRDAQQPVRKLVATVAAPLDASDRDKSEKTDCAYKLMEVWAQSDALLTEPNQQKFRDRFQSIVLRQQFALSLTILALKLRDRGYVLTPNLEKWLKSLNDAVLKERKRLRGNLYTWSGANALAFSLLSFDKASLEYAEAAWHSSIAAIGADGFVGSERRRGQRALAYHQFYLTALLMLRELREASGLVVSAADSEAIARLNTLTSAGLCSDRQFANLTGQTQWIPAEWAFRLVWSFGDDLVNDSWRRCGKNPRNLHLATAGGDLVETKAMLRRLRRDHSGVSSIPPLP